MPCQTSTEEIQAPILSRSPPSGLTSRDSIRLPSLQPASHARDGGDPGAFPVEVPPVGPNPQGFDTPAVPEARQPPRREPPHKRVHGDEHPVRLKHPAGPPKGENVDRVEYNVEARPEERR